MVDAGFLAVPDRIDGTRARSMRFTRRASCGTWRIAGSSRRRRAKVWAFLGDGETDEPESLGRVDARVTREARQPDLRRQLQPAAARWPGARQRQDHQRTRSGIPRRRLERDQGSLGLRLGSLVRTRHQRPASEAHGRVRRRRVSELQGQGRRLRPRSTSSASIPSCSNW